MPRVELVMCLLAGSTGGLCGTLWSTVVSPALLAAAPGANPPASWRRSAARSLQGAVIYAVGGGLLGFLFWLSWGLVALVEVPWPVQGSLFGALCWCGGALPAFATLHLRMREPSRLVAVLALEWLVACLAAGLLCALAWHRTT